MSIYLSFFSEVKKGIFSREINRGKIKKTIKKIIDSENGEFIEVNEDSYIIKLSPAGAIYLRYEGDQLIGDAQTNIAGPGFHKAIIDLLDKISSELNVDIDVEDETTYANERNFKNLQNQYQQWLKSFITEFVNSYDLEIKYMYVSWPFKDWVPIKKEGLITQMGIYSKEFCEEILNKNKIEEFSENYFPWFNNKKDALYYKGMALYLMWNEFCWVKPRTKEEMDTAEKILSYLAAARSMNKDIPLPIKEWSELANLVGKPNINVSPPELFIPGNIGYRRNNIYVKIIDKWELIIPGRMIFNVEEGEYIFWDEDKEIIISAYIIDEENPPFVLKEIAASSTMDSKIIEYVNDKNYHYKARYRFIPDKKSPPGSWKLTGQVNSPDSIITIKISWVKDSDVDWALKIFDGIKGIEK